MRGQAAPSRSGAAKFSLLKKDGRLWIAGEQLERRTEGVEKPTRSKETEIAGFQLAFSLQKGGSLKSSEGPLLDEIRETG